MRAVQGVVTLLATILAISGSARGAEPVWTLLAPPSVRALSVVRIEVVGLNPGFGEVLSVEPEPTLSATFRTATAEYPVALLAASDAVPMTVEPRSFATRTYLLTVPDAPEGEATLSVTVGGRQVAAALRVAIDAAPPSREPLPTTAAVLAFPRTHPNRLSIHMPNYFVYGARRGAGGEVPVQRQVSAPDLRQGEARSPSRVAAARIHAAVSLGHGEAVGAVLRHELHARGVRRVAGAAARALGLALVPRLVVGMAARVERTRRRRLARLGHRVRPRGLRLRLARGMVPRRRARDWQRLGAADHMPDIEAYRGHGRILTVAGYGSGPSLASSLTPDQDFQHLSYQLDLYVPITLGRLGFASYFLVQYFDGYAESIRDYTHESQSLRVGFSLVR